MNILVVDNLLLPFDPEQSPGGTERRNLSDSISFAKEGHNTYLTICGPFKEKLYKGVKLVNLIPVSKEETDSQSSWRKEVLRRLELFCSKNKIDVVHYGCNAHYWIANFLVFKRKIPLTVHIGNLLTTNAMYDSGRLQTLYALKEAGVTFTFNTQTCEQQFHKLALNLLKKTKVVHPYVLAKLADKNSFRLTNHINLNNQGWGAVGNKSIKRVFPSEGYAIIACRVDPIKKLHLYEKIDFPCKIYLKYRKSTDLNNYSDNLLARLRTNKNIEIYLDEDYSLIQEAFSKAALCLVTCPTETFGITAFEASSFGVPTVVLKKSSSDINATEEFLKPLYEPKTIEYRRGWREELSSHIKSIDNSIENRIALARKTKEIYSYEKYITERLERLKELL